MLPRVLIPALALITFGGCDPKPIADLPGLSAEKKADSSERAIPGGKTLATALTLLDPRVSDPEMLDRRRNDFEGRLKVLGPEKADRERLGFDRVIRWHNLYTRRLKEQNRAVESHRKRLSELLRPPVGKFIRIDETGTARLCETVKVPPPELPVQPIFSAITSSRLCR